MHIALLISEVLGCILGHLAADTVRRHSGRPVQDTDKAGRRALAALARTCRAFSEPALDAVWRRLHSLKPFLLCLPTKASYDDTTMDGALVPPFNEEEWNVVLRYAARVQELTLEYDEASLKILQSLLFHTTLPLPNLRSLRWMYWDHTAVPSIRSLLSPSLVDLRAWVENGDHASFLEFLESYPVLCPNLKSLDLGCPPCFPHVAAAISRAISRSPNLESLGCSYIDEAALVHVTQSRCLKIFRSNLTNYQPDTLRELAGSGTPYHTPFENLCILELHVNDLSSIIPYLQSQHQPFEEVTFVFRMVSTPKVLHELFTALSSATRRRTLRRINLGNPYLSMIGHMTSSQHVGFQVLKPLMTLDLHRFDISIGNPISFNDDEFVQLAQAWPELETLNMNKAGGWSYPTSVQIPTLRGLVLLLARCPKLRGLAVSVDATNIPSLSEAESLIRNTSVTSLSVANSPIQDPVTRVAHFLHEHLPSLTEVLVCICVAGGIDYHWMWKRIDEEIGRIVGRPPRLHWPGDSVMP